MDLIEFKNQIDQLESLVVQRQFGEAEKLLNELLQVSPPRPLLYRMANLASRIHQPFRALEILSPYMYPTGRKVRDATVEERSEYAVALTYVGAAEEALGVLNTVEARGYPLALLYRALAYFSLWNYSAAVPILTEFVERHDVDLYRHLVGRVNLIAALIRERHFLRAKDLISTTQPLLEPSFPLLLSNILELTAQLNIFTNDYKAAEEVIQMGMSQLSQSSNLTYIYFKKWQIILELFKSPESKAALAKLHAFKEEVKTVHGETYRDCDRFEAILRRNSVLFTHLYFGTPFTSYRQHLLADFDPKFQLPETYQWKLGEENKKGGVPLFDVMSGEGMGRALKKGSILHKLFLALTMDFYRPMRVAVLHFQLYPDQQFNPETSPRSIYETIRRLRNWFDENCVPLDITSDESFYTLVAKTPIKLQVEHRERVEDKNFLYYSLLKEKWPNGDFGTQDVMTHCNMSERTAQRLLAALVRDRFLERRGAMRYIRYFFSSQ